MAYYGWGSEGWYRGGIHSTLCGEQDQSVGVCQRLIQWRIHVTVESPAMNDGNTIYQKGFQEKTNDARILLSDT